MAVFTYDTGQLMDVDIGDDNSWLVSVVHDGSQEPHCYAVAADADPELAVQRSALSDLLERLGHRVWIKYRVKRVWNEDGTSRTDRILIDVDDIGDVMDAKSRFWEWSLLPTVGVLALIIIMVLAFTGLGPVAPAGATTRTARTIVANGDIDGNSEIVSFEYPGGGLTNLSNDPAMDHSPALSPDGTKVAFVSTRATDTENVWLMDSDGGNARNLSYMAVIGSAISRGPAWSPDGSMIAFSSTRYGSPDIWLMSADGSSTWSVTWDSRWDAAPAFSADGSRIYFASDGRITSVALDGSDRQEVSDPGAADALADYDPAIAPNGTHLAFWRDSYPGGSKLMLMRTDGSELRELATNQGVAREPSWLLGSTLLVFSSDQDQGTPGVGASTDLYAYDVNSGDTVRLTTAALSFGNPSAGDIEVDVPSDGGVMSATPPVSAYYFAEGTVRDGFVQYFTIQNPTEAPADALIEYQASNDAGAPVAIPSQTVSIAAGSRATVNVNSYVASRQIATPVNVSAKITSDSVIVAERALYFNLDPGLGHTVDGGTAMVGARGPALDWKFAEGTVRDGFVQYFTIQNPGADAANVVITYQLSTDSGTTVVVPAQQVAIPAGTRATVNVNQYFAAAGLQIPVNVSAAISSNVPVVAERPMYFSTDPGLGAHVDGGTVVAGVTG